ncbi:hypothetical protein QP028_06810 [Corynebacterium suedekumii]|nr:hypothetical protein QP028_06810 [Corynebacterium suedekumii]
MTSANSTANSTDLDTEPRTPSLLDASCEGFVYDLAALSPTDATAWGIPGHDGELQDFSPTTGVPSPTAPAR